MGKETFERFESTEDRGGGIDHEQFKEKLDSRIGNNINVGLLLKIVEKLELEDHETNPGSTIVGSENSKIQFQKVYELIKKGCEQNIPEAGPALLMWVDWLTTEDPKQIEDLRIVLNADDPEEYEDFKSFFQKTYLEPSEKLWMNEAGKINQKFQETKGETKGETTPEKPEEEFSVEGAKEKILTTMDYVIQKYKDFVDNTGEFPLDSDKFEKRKIIEELFEPEIKSNLIKGVKESLIKKFKDIDTRDEELSKEQFLEEILGGNSGFEFIYKLDSILTSCSLANTTLPVLNEEMPKTKLSAKEELEALNFNFEAIDNCREKIIELLSYLDIEVIIPEIGKDYFDPKKHEQYIGYRTTDLKAIFGDQLSTMAKINKGHEKKVRGLIFAVLTNGYRPKKDPINLKVLKESPKPRVACIFA